MNSNKFEFLLRQFSDFDNTFPFEINSSNSKLIHKYGTAGFRDKSFRLKKVSCRLALGLYLRSIEVKKPIGIMISASHNPYYDNGFKVADLNGNMPDLEWEGIYERLVNTDNIMSECMNIINESNISILNQEIHNNLGLVLIGYDTRESSVEFNDIISKSLTILKCNIVNYGLVTTPQLHFLTFMNQKVINESIDFHKKSIKISDEDYFSIRQIVNKEYYFEAFGLITTNFFKLVDRISSNESALGKEAVYDNSIILDTANGICGHEEIRKSLISNFSFLKINFINTNTNNYKLLNHLCGAEHIQKSNQFPTEYLLALQTNKDKSTNENYKIQKSISFDGDADRIVYFSKDSDENLILIDGDMLNCFFVESIKFIYSKLSSELKEEFKKHISIGIICTAYSNGSFLNRIKNDNVLFEMNAVLNIAKTGVKFLNSASEKFDISVLFEANGHGKISYIDDCLKKITKLNSFCMNSNDILYLELLSNLLSIFNPTVGDAISVMLAAESCLYMMNKSISYMISLYSPLKFIYGKTKVNDKSTFICNDNETRLNHPTDLQSFIDEEVKNRKKDNLNRCFVRPSGTEDILRIYVEGRDEEEIKDILKVVEEYILKNYN